MQSSGQSFEVRDDVGIREFIFTIGGVGGHDLACRPDEEGGDRGGAVRRSDRNADRESGAARSLMIP